MVDSFGRKIDYVRISVTDRCNLRCRYCMAEHMQFLPKRDILTLEEIVELGDIFIARGVRRIRLTGGEPLVRRGVGELFRAPGRRKGQLQPTGAQNYLVRGCARRRQLLKMRRDHCQALPGKMVQQRLVSDGIAAAANREKHDAGRIGSWQTGDREALRAVDQRKHHACVIPILSSRAASRCNRTPPG